MELKIKVANSIDNDFRGIESVSQIYTSIRKSKAGIILLDFREVGFFSANLCSAIGALIVAAGNYGKIVQIQVNENGKCAKHLKKNGFLKYFGHKLESDIHGTTINFIPFHKNDEESFVDYVNEKLFGISKMPKMSKALKVEVSRCLGELFINAKEHGPSELIFSCGQLFPKKQKIDLTISNYGQSIGDNVRSFPSLIGYSDSEAIQWALKSGNSTKKIDAPKGLGLDIILDFLKLNRGRLFIASGFGYFELSKEYPNGITKTLSNPFPGTIVNIEVDSSDINSYILSSEQ